jgi:hypothetical protein
MPFRIKTTFDDLRISLAIRYSDSDVAQISAEDFANNLSTRKKILVINELKALDEKAKACGL